MDRLSAEDRSRNMSRIRGRDTTPEIAVRRVVHSMGYRFRLHRSDLPGKPDIVLPKHRAIILVNGCFWHRHRCRRGRSMPSTRVQFWKDKFEATRKRDRKVRRQLKALGWSVLVVWECRARKEEDLRRHLADFFEKLPQSA